MKRVLITGAGGLVGKRLTATLQEKGYDVSALTRTPGRNPSLREYLLDHSSGQFDPEAFRDGDTIIHLAGANISEKRWSQERKEEIISSRVGTAALIHRATLGSGLLPAAFISSSATGYYGTVTSERIFTEEDVPASDFLGETCRRWEEAASLFEKEGVRTVMVRTAVVLAPSGSALSKMGAPMSAGLAVRFGPGNQYFPWIHLDDLCNIYAMAAGEESMSGPYNAAAPGHVTHDMFIRELAARKRVPVFLPHVPPWLLRLLLGEMSEVLTTGSRVSPEKLLRSGFVFSYPVLSRALEAC